MEADTRVAALLCVKSESPNGYLTFYAYPEPGRKITTSVHVSVGRAWLENPNSHPLIRHLDDNKKNNSIANLAWGTYQENNRDTIEHGRRAENRMLTCRSGLHPKTGPGMCKSCVPMINKISYLKKKDSKLTRAEREYLEKENEGWRT